MTLETPEGIKHWLESIGKDRHWLAERLKATKGTVDQWFSKGFPPWAIEMLRLIQSSKGDGKLELRWTSDEWKEIQEAMANAGYTDEFTFFQDGILFFAGSINKGDTSKTARRSSMATLPLVAERGATYIAKPARKRTAG